MRALQTLIERIIISSRFILVAIHLGLVLALALFAAQFLYMLAGIVLSFPAEDKATVLLVVLSLIDKALIAVLIFTVIVSTYDNHVARLELSGMGERIPWLGKLDAGSLKVKVASAIAAISLIHMLQIHLNSENFSGEQILWKVVVHVVLIASAVSLAFLDRLVEKSKDSERTGI